MLDVNLAAMRRLVEGRDYRPLFVTVIGDMRCGGRGVSACYKTWSGEGKEGDFQSRLSWVGDCRHATQVPRILSYVAMTG